MNSDEALRKAAVRNDLQQRYDSASAEEKEMLDEQREIRGTLRNE